MFYKGEHKYAIMLDISKAQLIAKRARESISSYCIDECGAYCCRKGQLTLNVDNVLLFVDTVAIGVNNKTIKKLKFDYILDMNKGCPNLDGAKCKIHTNVNRPTVCLEFPLFLESGIVRLSPKCPAIQAGKMYPFVTELINCGYKLQ